MRLLVVEDDAPLAEGLQAALRQSGFAVDWLSSGTQADTALLTQEYDAIILDLGLPGIEGFEMLKRLRGRGASTPVLILSARDGAGVRVAGLDLGADDYLTKPFDLPELEARLRALIRRSQGRAGARLALGDISLDTVERRVEMCGAALDLTAREFGMLEILLQRAGHVVPKQHLAERLCEWGEEMSPTAVEIHIHRLRRKLDGGGVAIRTLRGFGYLLEAADGA
jgi:two-component system OmpR family response regulator